jgi:hypothetical protein
MRMRILRNVRFGFLCLVATFFASTGAYAGWDVDEVKGGSSTGGSAEATVDEVSSEDTVKGARVGGGSPELMISEEQWGRRYGYSYGYTYGYRPYGYYGYGYRPYYYRPYYRPYYYGGYYGGYYGRGVYIGRPGLYIRF